MNTDISSLIDIRELALGAFSGLPRPYCKKKSTQRRPVPFGPRLPSLGAARFDDCASDCAAKNLELPHMEALVSLLCRLQAALRGWTAALILLPTLFKASRRS